MIGVTGQFSAVDSLLTGEENLMLMADLHHLGGPRAGGASPSCWSGSTSSRRPKPAATYSGGMRRRLDLAMTLMGDPRIIFLDEPTTGLDPRSRRTMWRIIRELVAGGVTIFLTTQYLEEADQLADRIAVLDHGRLIAEGTPDELKRLVPGGHIRLQFADPPALESAAAVFPGLRTDDDDARRSRSRATAASRRSAPCSIDSTRRRSRSRRLSVHTPDLDDVFLALTGRSDHGSGSVVR